MGWFLGLEEGGVGLNFDILETNLINLAIIIGVLFYFGRKFIGKILDTRKTDIETAILDAEQRKREAAAALAEQQQKLALAKEEAQTILANAAQTATRTKEEILAQAEADVARMQATAAQDVSSQQARVMRELRQRVATLALERSEAELPNRLNDDVQRRLVDASIAMLEGDQ